MLRGIRRDRLTDRRREEEEKEEETLLYKKEENPKLVYLARVGADTNKKLCAEIYREGEDGRKEGRKEHK